MIKELHYKYYVFLDKIDNQIKKNLLKFNNINIIINIQPNDKGNLNTLLNIIKFSKKNKIPFLLKNSFQKCIQHKANGVFIDSNNKTQIKPFLLKKEFQIIGSVHNQREYFRKLKQNCYTIIVSPLFYTEKYSNNQILNILKFSQISREWKVNLCALGGINFNNIKKTRMIKIKSLAFRKLINEKNLPTI